jgi:vancomycin permeability regulator SanA
MNKIFSVILIGLITLLFFSGCGIYTDIPYKRAKKRAPYDVVIVPGFPYEKRPDLNIIYRVRMFWAYHLYMNGITRNVMFSGGAVHTPYVEAKIMAEYAKQMGIPQEHIFIEDSAEHSTENLFYGYRLAKRMGFEKIAVATDPFQSGMIAMLTNKDKIPVDFIPAKIEIVATRYWKSFRFNINDKLAHKEDFVPLVERISKEERKKGTKGDSFRERNSNVAP